MSSATTKLRFCWYISCGSSSFELASKSHLNSWTSILTQHFSFNTNGLELKRLNLASYSSYDKIPINKVFFKLSDKSRGHQFIQKRSYSSSIEKYLTNSYFVNGEWKNAKSTFPVHNPFSKEVLAEAANCTKEDTLEAINYASCAFKQWRKTTGKERTLLLQKWLQLMIENKKALAEIITAENGKPLREALVEVDHAAGFIEWLAEEAKRSYGLSIPSSHPAKRMMTIKQPIGVAGMITPWNVPSAMVTRKASAAIAAGCTVVLKPAEDTPYSALALAKLAQEAGIPNGVFNVLPASRDHAQEVGEAICKHQDVTALSFTGSTATGKILNRQCADTVKKVSLELGGLAPFIIFESADLDRAVAHTVLSKFRNMGQACVCANRIYVHENVHDQYVEKLTNFMNQELKMGDPMDPETTFGPLINDKAISKMESQVNDAIKKGAHVVLGGSKNPSYPSFYPPTLLTDVTPDMVCFTEETFGPVASVVKFKSEKEVVELANKTQLGLAGYFFSNDVSQCWRVAEELEVGMVGINEGFMNAPEAPFGGVKESGLGRECSCLALDEFSEIKYICWGVEN